MNLKDLLKIYSDHPDFLGMELVDVNQRGAVDDAPLHIAARQGDMENLCTLLLNGADPNLAGDLGNTPLHFAAMNGNLDACKKLLEFNADIARRNEFGQNSVDVAKLAKKDGVISFLQNIASNR